MKTMPNIVSFFIVRVFIYTCVVALVVSCHQHEEMEEDPFAISFASNMAEEETRATVEGLEKYATEFFVYGYKTNATGTQTVFDGESVQWTEHTAGSTNSNTCDWEYVRGTQYIRYWDFSATEYRFFGTTESDSATVDSENQKVSWTFNGVDAANTSSAPFFSYLWYSNGTSPYPTYGSTVQLKFLHPFCQVCIKFIAEDGSQYINTNVLKTGSIQFAPATTTDGALITKGDFTVTYPMSGTDKEYSFAATSTTTIAAITEPYETGTVCYASSLEKWYTLIPPTQSSQGDYTLSVKLGIEDKKVTVPATMMQWKPGFQYTYTFKVPDDAGIFLLNVSSVAIQEWTDQTVSHTVYNW